MRRILASLLFVLCACSSDKETRPAITECTQNCGTVLPGGGGGGAAGAAGAAGGAGAAGAAGQAGSAGAAPLIGVPIQGAVVVHADTNFQNPTVYAQAALVSGAPSDVSLPPADNWLGNGTFTLNQVAAGESWLKAIPTALSESTLGGLLQLKIDPNNNPSIDVPVVDTGVIATILGLLPGSPVLTETAAHAVITFVTSTGTPAAGVQVTPSFGAIKAYDSGPQFTDTETGSRGQALLLNAQPTTGSSVQFVTKTGDTGTVPLLLEGRVVTFVTVQIP